MQILNTNPTLKLQCKILTSNPNPGRNPDFTQLSLHTLPSPQLTKFENVIFVLNSKFETLTLFWNHNPCGGKYLHVKKRKRDPLTLKY